MSDLNLSLATKAGVGGAIRIRIPPNERVRLIANDPENPAYKGKTEFRYPVDGRFEHEVGWKIVVPAASISTTTGLPTKMNGRPTRIRCNLIRVAADNETAFYDVAVPFDNDTLVFDTRGGINRYEVEGVTYAVEIEHNSPTATIEVDQWFYKRTFKSTT